MARARKSGADVNEADSPVSEDAPVDTATSLETETTEGDVSPEAEIPEPEEAVISDPEPVPVEAAPELSSTPDHAPVAKQRGGFFPMVLGGAVAAGLGFGAAAVVLPNILTPPEPPKLDTSAFEGQIATQNERITSLTAQLEELKSDTTLADLAAAQSDLAAQLATQIQATTDAFNERIGLESARLETLDARLVELEKRPVEDGAASALALQAFGREMTTLREEIAANREANATAQAAIAAAAEQAASQISSVEARAVALKEEAETVGQHAAARAALSRAQAALESGTSLEESLADFKSAGVAVPDILSEQAASVPSFAALRTSFPIAARKALAASLKETAGENAWDRVGAFLKSQTGARSLSPRAGDDADAVLSRAEAALHASDLEMAVAELAKLPETGQAQMAEWVAMAQRRIAVTAAIADIARAMN